MASNYTTNYNLCQWEASDKVLRTDFNADNAKIDAALAAKADASALKSLSSTVNGKASQADLESLQAMVTAHAAALKLRNCRLVYGGYTGTGVFGEAHPNSILFATKPLLFIVTCSTADASFFAINGQTTIWHRVGGDQVKQIVSWENNTIKWYNVSNLSAASPDKQLNANGVKYHYFVIQDP